MPSDRRIKRLREVLETRQNDLSVVIENIWDPLNVSAILRSADGFANGTPGTLSQPSHEIRKRKNTTIFIENRAKICIVFHDEACQALPELALP